MTDAERKRTEVICKIACISNIEDLSDGFHTFRQLYYQRMMLFAALVKQNRDKAWKSLKHADGELCFGGGWFIVGITTPEGEYTYHYENIYYSLFDCEELERGKRWDGHTEKDVTRLLTLPFAQSEQKTGRWIKMIKHHKNNQQEFDYYEIWCSECGEKPEKSYHLTPYCPWCGAKMEIEE